MYFAYDYDADALYITIADSPVAGTHQLDEGTLVDLDESGGVVGIEVLRPARDWPLEDVKSGFSLGEDEVTILDSLWGGTRRGPYPFAKPVEFV